LKPRIGVNLLWLLPGEATGAEEYAVRLLRALHEVATDALEVLLLCNRRFAGAHPELADAFETEVVPLDGGSRSLRIATESTWLRRRAGRLHVVHHLNNVVPWIPTRPLVLTIHDLRPLEHPETIGRGQGAYLRTRFGPSVRKAAVITTPSGFVRTTVIERLGAAPDRVRVVSAPVFPPIGSEGDERPVGRPFFLYPAKTARHKNHGTLLEAFAQVVAAREDALLVLTGPSGPSEASVAASIARHGLTEHVRRLGRVPTARLDALLREAVALTYPSTYEGFGLPIVEAMAVGCPVIASNVTALPEVVGDAGVLIDPGDVEGWAGAMLALLSDDHERARLAALGRTRVGALSPQATARDQVEVYRLALARG
jgi:glycosyltransferase involved in cell wall biosynthesis